MCQVPEGARVASPDGSHRQRPSRAEDRLGGNRLPGQAAGGQAHSSASPAAFPARATVFGRVIGSYAGSVAPIGARGPVSSAILVRMMPQMYPDLATAARQSRPGSGLRDLPPAQTAVAAAIRQQFPLRGRDPPPGPGNPTARPRDGMSIRRGINGHEYGEPQSTGTVRSPQPSRTLSVMPSVDVTCCRPSRVGTA